MKKRSVRLLALSIVLALLVALSVGCGGDTASPSAAPQDGGTTQPENSAAPQDGGTTQPENSAAPQSQTPSDDSETYTLTLTLHVPASSINTKMMEMYAENVKEATNGRVDIQVFPGGVLAAGPSALEAVTNNTVDIAWCFSTFWPGQFPLTDVYAQPLLGVESCEQVTEAMWDLYDEYDELKTELDEKYKILQIYGNPPNNMFFGGSTKIDSLESLATVPLRAPAGPVSEIFTLWGANPIFMGPGDVYEALEKGIVNGYVLEYSGMIDFNLQELTNYYIDMNILSGPFILIMNKDVWNSLPADIQEQIDSVSGRDASVKTAEMFTETNDECREIALAQPNAEEITISDEEFAKFKTIADEYNQEWIEKYTTDSFDAKAYMDDAIAFLAKYA